MPHHRPTTAGCQRLFNSADKKRTGFLDANDVVVCMLGWYREHDINCSPALTRKQVTDALHLRGIHVADCSLCFSELTALVTQERVDSAKTAFKMPDGIGPEIMRQIERLGEGTVFKADQVTRLCTAHRRCMSVGYSCDS